MNTINPSESNQQLSAAVNVNLDGAPQDNSAPKSRRGFASMDPERRRQVASSGGRTAHQQGVAHKWSKEEASAAGRKGQQLRRENSDRQR